MDPQIQEKDEILSTLIDLSGAFGVSGFEEEVRWKIKEKLEPLAQEITVDPLGNIHGVLNQEEEFTVLLVAHMDEIGFMVTSISENGFLGLAPIGTWDPATALGKMVTIRATDGSMQTGIIGTIPPHIKGLEKNSKRPNWDDLFVDIGASSREEVEERKIRVGSPGVLEGRLSQVKEGVVVGKALDDRAGCAALIALLKRIKKKRPKVKVVAAYSVAEELGARGAKVIASRWRPKMALVIEGTACTDTPGIDQYRGEVKLGKGPVLTVADKSIVVPHWLVEAILKVARQRGLPLQIKPPFVGSTDAGAIHLTGEGVPTAVLAIPCRYIHSPASLMRLEDLIITVELLEAILDEAPKLYGEKPRGI